MGKVYFITDGKHIKIGTTKKDIKQRLKQLNTGSPLKLYLLGYICGGEKEEKNLHKKFSCLKIRDNGEWFYPDDSLIEYLNSINEMKNIIIVKNEYMNNFLMATLKIN